MKHSKFLLTATGIVLSIAGAFATKSINHYGAITVYTNVATGVCTKHSSHVCVGGGPNACLTGSTNGRTSGCVTTLRTGGLAF